MKNWVAVLLILCGLPACGGGSGGGGGPPAPSGLSYASPSSFPTGTPIAPLAPTVSGTVASYSITPTLPAGLALSTSTGVISGIPTAVSAATTYTVTASNSSGSTQANVSIAVTALPPGVGYPSPKIEYATGVAANMITPTATGGAVMSWSVAPPLPAGLTLDNATGAISGTPTRDTPSATYTVTATNSGGQSIVPLAIEVTSSQLLDLGQATTIRTLRLSTNRMLSESKGDPGHWDLRDYTSGNAVAAGSTSCLRLACTTANAGTRIELADQIFVIETANGLEIRAAADGGLRATVPGPVSWWSLAPDGTYLAIGNATGLKAYSSSGAALVSQAGDYSGAAAFATPTQIQIAQGPAGANVVQTIQVPGGAATVSPAFHGTFNSWFVDGGRFLTNTGNTVWVYSSAAVQEDLTSLPQVSQLSGQGNWFWISDRTGGITIYKVGASASPTASYIVFAESLFEPSGSRIGILPSGQQSATVIDLSGPAPVRSDYALPFSSEEVSRGTAFAATSASGFVIGNEQGAIVDGASLPATPNPPGTPRFLTLGGVLAIAASSHSVAMSFSTGNTLVMDPRTSSIQATLPFSASRLEMSSDGTILAAGIYGFAAGGQSVKVVSLPSAVPLATFSPPAGGEIRLSAAGILLEQSGVGGRQITAATGGPVLWSDQPNLGVASANGVAAPLSPDGTGIAANLGGDPLWGAAGPAPAVNLYRNLQLSGALTGYSPGWVGNDRVLVCQYTADGSGNYTVLGSCAIYDGTGTLISAAAALKISRLQMAGPTSAYYALGPNSIVSLTTGGTLWMSANTDPIARFQVSTGTHGPIPNEFGTPGVLTSAYVAFPSGTLVLAQPQ
jgi:hypothetical protein